ncbi:MAG: outer membrane lipoprotein carrier protein LolA [Bacteroidota bacterium]
MRRLFLPLLLVLCGFTGELFAQNTQYTSSQDSDPEAIALVSAVRKKYDAYRTLVADFRLEIALPGQPMESQQGRITRMGDKVRFKLAGQEGIINEEAAYIIQHQNKEVMINNLPDPEETSGVLTPQTLFNFYEGDNYVLAHQGTDTDAGRSVQIIELKPVDPDNSEFTKLRLHIDAKQKVLVSVKAFSRDASSFTFRLDKAQGNAAVAENTFVFRKADFPGYLVEDLRY